MSLIAAEFAKLTSVLSGQKQGGYDAFVVAQILYFQFAAMLLRDAAGDVQTYS
jgi:hypothetical protein